MGTVRGTDSGPIPCKVSESPTHSMVSMSDSRTVGRKVPLLHNINKAYEFNVSVSDGN